MSTEVLIAIVTSVASLLVAVVSLVSSITVSRQSGHSAQMIEALKFELAHKQSRQIVSDKYLDRVLESLDDLIQATQRFKDLVQLILSATGSSMDSESAVESLSESLLELFACYENRLPDLRDGEARGAHKAKNTALAIQTRLLEDLQGTSFVSELSEQQKEALLELRNDLTDCQNLLRDSRATSLAKRIQAI